MPKPVTTLEAKVTPDPKLEKRTRRGLYSRVHTINHTAS